MFSQIYLRHNGDRFRVRLAPVFLHGVLMFICSLPNIFFVVILLFPFDGGGWLLLCRFWFGWNNKYDDVSLGFCETRNCTSLPMDLINSSILLICCIENTTFCLCSFKSCSTLFSVWVGIGILLAEFDTYLFVFEGDKSVLPEESLGWGTFPFYFDSSLF